MGAFTRIFKYVWPQWPRLMAIFASVMVIAVLFAFSFATIAPLLKVIIGQEGMHGWINRKVCDWRYGISFHIPESLDFQEGAAKYLLVTSVEKDKQAEEAGILHSDKIVGMDISVLDEQTHITGRGLILKELADLPDNAEVKLYLKRSNDLGESTDTTTIFSTAITNESSQKPGMFSQINDGISKKRVDLARWAVSFFPEEQGLTEIQRKDIKRQSIIYLIIFMGIVTITRCIARFYQQYLASKVVQVAVAGLREDSFSHAMDLPIGFFAREGSSDTISRLIGDINKTGGGVKVLLGKALREPAKAIACLCLAMTISWQLVLIFLGCAPFTFGFAAVLGKRMKKYTKRSLASSALMLGRLREAIVSLRVVKVYNRQGYEHSRYHQINSKFLKQTLRAAKVVAATGPIMEVIGMFAGSAALLVGVHWITRPENPMDPTEFFLLLILLGTSAESIRKASDVINKVQKANAAAERVFAVVDRPAEEEKPNAIELQTLNNKIEFKDVTFTYPGSDKPILKGVNLTVQDGHNIAVVGPNGSGKTTLINLIPRFYNADSGSILIDGQDIKDGTLKSLREQIAMVTQNVATFNDTIAANIAYGKPDATMEEIIDAAKRSFAHEFIEPMQDGYETIIGEDGAGLSGGQLQRIVIARAILKNPPILIFDEATSQVDARSEARIHDAIEEIMKDRTSFIIAHRFSTVISADTIVVMDNGKIVSQGSHAELMQSSKLYQSLYENQLMLPEED